MPVHMSGGQKRLSSVCVLSFSTSSFEAGSLSEPVFASLGWKPPTVLLYLYQSLGCKCLPGYPACSVGAVIGGLVPMTARETVNHQVIPPASWFLLLFTLLQF